MKKYPFLVVFVAGVLAYACGDGSHIFLARQLDETRDCLGDVASVDVVVGDQPPECDAACLTQANDDGGPTRFVWLATMCPPYPHDFDAAGTDPACGAALAAGGRHDLCLEDGGSSAPYVDAGGDADVDANVDSGADASVSDAGADGAIDSGMDAGDAGPG